MRNNEVPRCPFCEGDCTFSYKIEEYGVFSCIVCGTAQTFPSPIVDDLKEYYDGFMFQADFSQYESVQNSFELLLRYLSCERGGRMLDIGGGGGFFAKSYSELGYGDPTYIDLDSEACSFAQSLGLNVICGSAEDPSLIVGQFDLIFSRHLIEHLINPVRFVERVAGYLAPGGKLVLMFPNGSSREYLSVLMFTAFRLLKVLRSNAWNPKVLVEAMGSKIHHGIAPPRHLWAITEEGVNALCKRNGYVFSTETFMVDDPMVSPYFHAKRWKEVLHVLIGRKLAQKCGGAHLMCVIQLSRK